jgi:hypothetical protein
MPIRNRVAGYIVHVGTESGTYTQRVDVGNTTVYIFTSAMAGQRYCFALSAYFAGPIEGPKSAEVCGFSNRPPTLVNPGARSSVASQSTTLQLQGTVRLVAFQCTDPPAQFAPRRAMVFISRSSMSARHRERAPSHSSSACRSIGSKAAYCASAFTRS